MIQALRQRDTKLSWIKDSPNTDKTIALLIPQYNESAGSNLDSRLTYFKGVADKFRKELDVIIIDDGSTDDSLSKIKDFLLKNDNAFYLASVYPNANKVGALFLTTLAIQHEIIILSDFDTDIAGIDVMIRSSDQLKKDKRLMGCYFRMLPYEGSGLVFLFQQLEYSLARSLYKHYEKEQVVPVMPGAGSCYRREVLNSIYYLHSGLRSGEDREATLIGLKLGFKAIYLENVLTLTRPPLTFWKLVNQRIRWNLGYLETFYKERAYYLSEVKKFRWIGKVTLLDAFSVLLAMLRPITALALVFINIYLFFMLLGIMYLIRVSWCFYLLFLVPEESREFKGKRIYSLLFYPFFIIGLDSIAWIGSFLKFFKNRRKEKKYSAIVNSESKMGKLAKVNKNREGIAS
jgi:cellulose synthase/poly-beta-1,6-N-acetylglucosamine synthase-like glycosyltransferase